MNSIYRSLFPLFFLFISFFGLVLSSKVREGFRRRRERLKSPFLPQLNESFWIHASSGEYEYARPIVTRLKKEHPHTPVVVTYFSPTYSAAIEKDPLVDFALPLPFDFPGAVRGFIKKIKPRTLFIARTDLWPEVLMQCQQRKIPTILFSYYQSEKRNPLSRFLRGWLLKKITHIDCVSEETRAHVEKITERPATHFGDTRYDRVMERKANSKTLPFLIPQKKVIVLGSTWREDEDQIFPALKNTEGLWELAIIAPHEPTPDHIESLKKRCEKQGFTYETFSETEAAVKGNVLIVDKVGWLFDLYRFSSLSFVGGSFKSTVHSVMEPLAHGSRLFLGPKIQNNAEALEFQSLMFQSQFSPIRVTESSDEISEFIREHFSLSQDQRDLLKQWIEHEVEKRSGASDRLLKHLKSLALY